ncbi:hypothetical protein POTOM_039311 [Populus tomentosa]|uniref:Uncharacterized protein n=1 Tax=Populus tomentosa TaxID=118781 RepID=A0A8X7YMD3_POPTO|nr:hypothetical protein POTOM_039311 [Populus tomentosa]
MALSCSVSLTAASGWPFPQNRNTERVKPILKEFKPTLPSTKKWSVSQKQTLAFGPTKQYPITINNEASDTAGFAEKLQTFKHILRKEGEEPIQGLAMIDAIQRLCIDYHFQEEIDSILTRQSMLLSTIHSDNNLYEVALRFRLLRQQGYHVSAGVFDNFKDSEGRFKQKLSSDIMGLVSLYEASQLSIRGEDVLDEAGDYSYQLLRSSLTHLDNNQARLVRNSLDHPHHKSLASFTAKYYFNDELKGWISELQELAKTECERVQSQHQHEIVEILKWWKDLGLSTELRFARDQPLKWYMWSMACLTDPSLSEQRIELTKPVSMIYIIDDIFDVHGTLDELVCFTEVINRWDIAAAEQLPDYMKICFKALNNITNEISYKIYNKHGWNPADSLRKAWASLCRAFLVEARWFASGKLPSGEEYLKNGIVSSGVHVVLVHIFFLLGQDLSKENVELISNFPPIISSTATILRLWDDLGSAKDENQDGHDGSYVECYLRENEGSSFEDARKQVLHMISDAWKQLNQECLSPNPFSSTFSKASLNIARMVPLMYDYDVNHRLPSLEEHMKSLFYENVLQGRDICACGGKCFNREHKKTREALRLIIRKCWRRLFTVAERAIVGLWPIEEWLGVVGSVRVESGKKKRGTEVGGARGRSLVCPWHGKRGKDDVGLGGVWLRGCLSRLLCLVREKNGKRDGRGEWVCEIVNNACYVINRSPSTTIELKTSMEMWTGNPADYSQFYIFRSLVYMMYNTQEVNKLDSKSRKCVFLGYANEVKGYRLWDLTAHKNHTSSEAASKHEEQEQLDIETPEVR